MTYKQTCSRALFAYSALCRLIIITQALLFVSGCAAVRGYPERVTDPASDLSQLQNHINAERIADCLQETTPEARTRCRNEIIGARLYATDIQFSRFEEGLFQETRTAGFSATLASLGLTSAATGAGGVAAQVLSGAAAFIIGGREAYQKEVLAERTLVAIHTAMRAGRARVGLRIREGLGQHVEQYPLEVALADLNAYYDAGTVLGALVGITEAVGAEAQRVERLQEQLSFRLDPSAQSLRDFVCSDDPDCANPDQTKFPQIRDCWPAAGVPTGTNMFDFVFQDAFAAERRAVEGCLGL